MITTAQPKSGITYPDFLAMPRTTQPHEILDGVLRVYKTPSVEQQWLVMRLLRGRRELQEHPVMDVAPDLEAETVEALALSEGGYERSGLFGIGDTIASPVLPDLGLTVDAIFED